MNKNVELKYCDPPKPSTPYEGRKDLEVLAQVFWKGESDYEARETSLRIH